LNDSVTAWHGASRQRRHPGAFARRIFPCHHLSGPVFLDKYNNAQTHPFGVPEEAKGA